ncbi:MAG: DUF6067 family protein [Acidobacteriia bacterium]|nr:DUF6067 family protein [Terriglobia bacterium]
MPQRRFRTAAPLVAVILFSASGESARSKAGPETPVLPSGQTSAASSPTAPGTPPLTDVQLGQVLSDRAKWGNNRLGITDEIPPPWAPISASGGKVGCWGRSYDFLGSLFPRQVTSQKSEILAGPITLVGKIGGRDLVFQTADHQAITPARNQVDLDSVTVAAGVTVRVTSHLEYDGCIKITLSLSPETKPVVLEGLELRIPFKAERALYYHWFEASRDPRLTNAGELPAGGLKSHFKPLLWLGDDDRGLCWFAESPKDWQVADKESVLSVEPGNGATVVRVRMMDRPFALAKPWQTVFGLMATPARPMPPGWRDLMVPLNVTNPWHAWAPGFNNLSGSDDPGTLYPRDPAAMKAWVERTRERGERAPFYPTTEATKVVPYSAVVFWTGKYRDGTPSPEIQVFGPEWSSKPQREGPRPDPVEQIPLKEEYGVCPSSSFAQFYIYQLDRLIDETGIDGLYIDGSWWFCSNKLHGCGYEDDQGKWQPQYNIWAFRELFKRIYCLFYQKHKDPLLFVHTSSWLAIPSLSFAHLMLDGEQYHDPGQKVEDHFMDVVPLDKWRAEHTGKQWGPAPFILPDIPSEFAKGEAATRELLMLTNLHDTGIFPGNLNLRLAMRNYQAKRLFGVADSEFRGYWGDRSWVACDTPGGLVSVYRKPDGSRALLVVGNTSKADGSVAVRPLLEGLKLKGKVDAGVDLETGERVPLEGGALAVPVKGRDFRLVALPFYAPPPITAGDLAASAVAALPNPGFEDDLDGWQVVPVQGNEGSVEADTATKSSGKASCHLHTGPTRRRDHRRQAVPRRLRPPPRCHRPHVLR